MGCSNLKNRSQFVYIGMGSNLGDRMASLIEAIHKMEVFLQETQFSSIWETAPQIIENQPSFLNMVFCGFFSGPPEDLIKRLWVIEQEAGRNRKNEIPKGPRPLDLDILLYGEEQIKTDILTIPHPLMTERAFVLAPLTEIRETLKEPSSGILYRDYLASIVNQDFICYKNQAELKALLEENKDRHV